MDSLMTNSTKLPVTHRIAVVKATRAENDEQLLQSWLKSLSSPHTRRNFETTARRLLFELAELQTDLRAAKVEDVRDALEKVTIGVGKATRNQYVLRVKSLLGYAHKVGYTPFNAGAAIKAKSDSAHRGATLAKRIVSPAEVGMLIRAAPSKRDRVMLEVAYAGGLRVSEFVALTWADVLPRDQGRVQLSITGKGGKVRCRRRSATATSQPHRAICMRAPTARAACAYGSVSSMKTMTAS
jgi:site-specific recombinase XerD